MGRDFLIRHIAERYAVDPEFLWRDAPETAIFRHARNRRWFALITRVPGSRFALPDAAVEVVNLKLPPAWVDELKRLPGFAPAYHMNKIHWLSLLPEHGASARELLFLLHESFTITAATPSPPRRTS